MTRPATSIRSTRPDPRDGSEQRTVARPERDGDLTAEIPNATPGEIGTPVASGIVTHTGVDTMLLPGTLTTAR